MYLRCQSIYGFLIYIYVYSTYLVLLNIFIIYIQKESFYIINFFLKNVKILLKVLKKRPFASILQMIQSHN